MMRAEAEREHKMHDCDASRGKMWQYDSAVYLHGWISRFKVADGVWENDEDERNGDADAGRRDEQQDRQ